MDVDLKSLLVLVDPVDSTNSLITKHYSEVTSLIGVLKDSKPYIGVIGSPCIDRDMIIIYFNIPGLGVYKLKMNVYKEFSEFEKINNNCVNKEENLHLVVGYNDHKKFQEILLKEKNLSSVTHINGVGRRAINILEQDEVYMTQNSGKII